MLFEDSKISVGEIVAEVAIEEIHVRTAKATEHPVEAGNNIADHILPESIQVRLEGVISNTPTTALGYQLYKSAKNLLQKKSADNDYAQTAFDKLEELFTKREPIKIVTSLKSYNNMVLENLLVRRDAATGDALRFTCSAKAIRLVDGKTIEIGKRRGVVKQLPVKAKPPEEKKVKSLLYSIFE
jgi:hypothetical protein